VINHPFKIEDLSPKDSHLQRYGERLPREQGFFLSFKNSCDKTFHWYQFPSQSQTNRRLSDRMPEKADFSFSF